jgi:predicted nucleic acid-binding protein
MNIIVDTNILLSALIKDSITREILVKTTWKFYYPEMSFHEVRKYKELVLKKSNLSEEAYAQLIHRLLEQIILIPDEIIIKQLSQAKKIMKDNDQDDVAFIAAGLSIKNSIIWTDDTDFEKQQNIHILKTAQIIDLFKKEFL